MSESAAIKLISTVQKEWRAIDEVAFSSENDFWRLILQQMYDGLL